MVAKNLVQKILENHDISAKKIEDYQVGNPIFVKVDQCITQDATGTMAWLEFEAIDIPEIRVPLAVSYIDHNTLQTDFRNADDHQFLRTIAAKKGAILSRPGNGIIHQVHLENFAAPGKILLGSDSHTPTAGGVGSIAVGVGGLVIATSMAGEAFELKYPKIINIHLTGKLRRPWVTAMDVILELLKMRGVSGGVKAIFEYTGPGVKDLTVPERATITNMGAELGATTSIFPSDEQTLNFLKAQNREKDYQQLQADEGAKYDEIIEINLSTLEPNVALPHSPGSVVTIRELVEKTPIDKIVEKMPDKTQTEVKEHVGRLYSRELQVDQVCIGSCTNASYLALATAASILKDHTVANHVSMTISPGSKNVFTQIAKEGMLADILASGARILEATCGPCI
ncbi:MAG: aconitase family protein [Candidatus Thorarchaeota archaeon]